MLAFITSLRHPDNSASYERVEKLLMDTLRSVTNQSSDEYVVIVVGNRRPAAELPPRVHFVEVGFDAPAPPTGPQTARGPFVWDKGTKIGIGLAAAREHNPDFVMIFDADDFVSRDLASFVAGKDTNEGWVVSEGIMYSRSRNVYVAQDDFNRTCGTSFVIPYSAYEVPASLTVDASQEEVAEAFGERLYRVLGAHREAREWFAQNGTEVNSLPFPAAVYHVDTGENHSGKSLTGVAKPLTGSVAREYGITPSRGPVSSTWSAFGPVALWESGVLSARHFASKVRRSRERPSSVATR